MNLSGKTAAILGVADRSSIAWAIAQRLLENGAKVHIGYQQKFFSRVRQLLSDHPDVSGARCDVLDDSELVTFFKAFEETSLDILVHGIAYGPPEVFTLPPSGVTSNAFEQTLTVSTHSLLKVVGAAKSCLRPWGSVITLTYQASEQASPFYGMMGVAKAALESCVRYLAIELGTLDVRVNAISPGPIETPAALGEMLAFLRNPQSLNSPAGAVLKDAVERLRRDPELSKEDDQVKAKALWHSVQSRVAAECALQEFVTQDDVADCALFLASDMARKITGQVIRVDCGMSTSRLMPGSMLQDTEDTPAVSVASAGGYSEPAAVIRAQTAETQRVAGATEAEGEAGDDGGRSVREYLRHHFRGCDITEVAGRNASAEAFRYFLIDGLGVCASLCVASDLLAQDTSRINRLLTDWDTAGLLRDSGRGPLVATGHGLRLALPVVGERVAEWSPEIMISPDYDASQPLKFDFPDDASRSAFTSDLSRRAQNAVRTESGESGNVLKIEAPRALTPTLVIRAIDQYGAKVHLSEAVRPYSPGKW